MDNMELVLSDALRTLQEYKTGQLTRDEALDAFINIAERAKAMTQ